MEAKAFMKNSRTKNSALIMITGGLRQILTLVLTFVSRTIFIHILGAEYLGLNGLFSNILSILSLSELGIGTAISFYLYKPLVDKNIERIKSLMHFYKICYRVVGIFIIVIGFLIMPFLPYMVNFQQEVSVNLYVIFGLNVLNTAATYLFFAYKQSLAIANQEQYKVEEINILFTILSCFLDSIVLIGFHNYIIYLVSKIILSFLKNLVIAFKIDSKYSFIKDKNYRIIEKKEKKLFFKDIGNIAIFKIGSVLFSATDNIIISILLGTLIVGYYSNYYMIISQVTILIGIIVNSFVAGIGNVVAKENKEKQYEVFVELDFIVYIIVSICTVCLFQLLNSFIMLWVGDVDKNYILSQSVVAFLCFNFYIDGTTQIPNSFREASGNFKTGKSLQILGGAVNIILSVFLGDIWGLDGIFCATILSKIFITIIPFLIGISRTVFGRGPLSLLIRYIFHFFVMGMIILIVWVICLRVHMTSLAGFFIEIFLSICISCMLIYLINIKRPEMKRVQNRIYVIIKNKKIK